MNDQALNDAYNLFSSQGYKGSIDEFKSLISSNGNALNDAHKHPCRHYLNKGSSVPL